MTKLAERATRLRFQTSAEVRSCGASRPIIITATPLCCVVRLLGTRQEFTVTWEAIHDPAGRQAADRARAERKSKKVGR